MIGVGTAWRVARARVSSHQNTVGGVDRPEIDGIEQRWHQMQSFCGLSGLTQRR
jgi:hypothetical protein